MAATLSFMKVCFLAWDEEPEEDIQDTVKMLADNYFDHFSIDG